MKKSKNSSHLAATTLAGEPRTIPESFLQTVTRVPNRLAIRNTQSQVHEPEEIRYCDLDVLSDRVAAALLDQGVQKGDRVILQSFPRIRTAATLLGIFKAGACAVPLDPSLTVTETQAIVEDAQPRSLCE